MIKYTYQLLLNQVSLYFYIAVHFPKLFKDAT